MIGLQNHPVLANLIVLDGWFCFGIRRLRRHNFFLFSFFCFKQKEKRLQEVDDEATWTSEEEP